MNAIHYAGSAIFGLAISALAAVSATSTAVAQESPFSNASMRGTYSHTIAVGGGGPNAPSVNFTRGDINYYDGEGNVRYVAVHVNRDAGVLDADGNRTRDLRRNVFDPSTWSVSMGTYEVSPFGTIAWTAKAGGRLDGIPTETEMIDGILTITQAVLFGEEAHGRTGGGVSFWYIDRIADGDWAPPAPSE